ncbi:hypothetical protein EJ02DRAFT_457918 [Clathrospora elynae]|uniref:Uncharacterized protein n=1 Tax=Clathrospora elynae TaxID=706981 RepID=A0A6A5SFH1_9PLEO|nr:hypothetical protein EJ02DRAFT_457918 [Clathrospora elynae]
MDHQIYQPVWPMLQGAFDYTLNLAGELWMMIWKPAEERCTQPVRETSEEGTTQHDKKWQVIKQMERTGGAYNPAEAAEEIERGH